MKMLVYCLASFLLHFALVEPRCGKSDSDSDLVKEIEKLKQTIGALSKQVKMQQFFAEERVRNDGGSGVKVVRGTKRGRKNYNFASHLEPAAFSIHDHSDYDRTLGLGEMHVVMNGVEFRTRHNDYRLVMPSNTSKDYHALQDVPFPPVPPEVSNQPNVAEQVREMRTFFKAFYTQNKTLRDYTKYFKPVLCYLEGAWTLDKNMDEPFPSDRHSLDASSWENLHSKTLFTSYTGVKVRKENIAFLPTSIYSVNETTGEAQYAQWNYRILCSPIQTDIPLSWLQQEDDLMSRPGARATLASVATARSARHKLYDNKRRGNYRILDQIMATIPGKDNYNSNLTYTIFSEPLYSSAFDNQNVVLNTAYYHRSYKSKLNGAGGLTFASLGFNDENLWVAQTSQPRVAPIHYDNCDIVTSKCTPDLLRITYALPMEIIYMTPLSNWNPYNIAFHTNTRTAGANGRDGRSAAKAFNGTDRLRYFRTPIEFFTGSLEAFPADTGTTFSNVLSSDGVPRQVSASGLKIVLPEIAGVGKIRLRYIIGPVYGEGSSAWKELNALKDKVWTITK